MTRRSTVTCVLCAVAAAAATVLMALQAPHAARADETAKEAAAPADPALERARAEVQKLDALYKNAVVSITKVYPKGAPAIRVAKDVFAAMEEGGHHSAKLVDSTGNPLGEDSEPKTPFEKRANKAMQDGKPYYEEVVGEGADRRLLAATVVPAVLPRCASCHGVNEGDLLGFIRYDLPVK
jgi:hypothetical protein